MSRKVLDVSLSIFLIVCSVSLIIGIFSLRPLFSSSLKVMDGSHDMVKQSTSLLQELTAGVAEGKKTPAEIVKLLQHGSVLVEELAQAISQTKDTPKELAGLLQEIRLLVAQMKETVVDAQKSQLELAESAENATDIIIEFGIASAAAALAEERILSPTDADQMIIQSITEIEKRSERLGKIARSINDFRLRSQHR
jgi:TolA-binding protein